MLHHLIAACLACLFTTGVLANDEFSSLEELMSTEEFGRAGLDKLTDDELRYLNQWLKKVKKATPPPRAAAAARSADGAAPETRPTEPSAQIGFRPKDAARVTIESQIDGEFNGWSGRTRFKLKNGMVWQQVGSGQFYYRATDPTVRIEPKSLGSWKLYVEGVGRGIKVKRVK